MLELSEKIENVLNLQPAKKTALGRLGIKTVRDFLYYFPFRYIEYAGLKKINELAIGGEASIEAEVLKAGAEKTWKKKLKIASAVLSDDTGSIKAVWFNQPYIADILKTGAKVFISGKVAERKGEKYFANPKWEKLTQLPITNYQLPVNLLPVYSETYGVTSDWLRWQIKRLLDQITEFPEIIPDEILGKYHLPSAKRALNAIHFPKKISESEGARKRFSFEEIFLIQLDRQTKKKEIEKIESVKITPDQGLIKKFVEGLPYRLTSAQEKVISQILDDFEKPYPMARLLEGDVGSGKTVVAAAICLNVVSQGYQAAFMAPTEILARQHFEEFMKRLGSFKIKLGLLTSSESKKFPSKIGFKQAAEISANQLLKFIASGEIHVLIGTHSLIQDRVKFKKLGFVVIDEQHRFGTEQRARLAKNKEEEAKHDSPALLKKSQFGFSKASPNLLSMTATPIPRTLALTIYGDLDLSLLDEMPPGRKRIITKVVPARERAHTYEFIRGEINKGRQAFVICPRIEPRTGADLTRTNADSTPTNIDALPRPSALSPRWSALREMKAVKEEYKKLKEQIFPEFEIGMLHGKLKPKEKEEIMKKFKNSDTKILVSTSVVEVGVDVPNATIMMIEGGERFGLAQLHQFRGRVGRGEHQSYCFVFTDKLSSRIAERLKALQDAKSGFELAEYDLMFRGPGELSGKNQWGMSDVGMEALKNIKMVEAARTEAQEIIKNDPELKKYPLLKKRLKEVSKTIHFE